MSRIARKSRGSVAERTQRRSLEFDLRDPKIPKGKFLESYLPYLFGHASLVINKDFDRYVRQFGISALEWRVLATLSDDNDMTIGALAHKVVAQQPRLTKAVQKMETGELVERRSDSGDLRKTRVHVTNAGRALFGQLAKSAMLHEQQWLRGMSPAQLRLLRQMLHSIIDRSRAPRALVEPD
jgi:DNA-binding MarR family transcriptional regulator